MRQNNYALYIFLNAIIFLSRYLRFLLLYYAPTVFLFAQQLTRLGIFVARQKLILRIKPRYCLKPKIAA